MENLFVKSTATSYTIYIWVESSASGVTGETIDVNVWTQIDQVGAWYGDANLDGELNLKDSVLISKYAGSTVEASPQSIKNADVNVDGVVDSLDFCLVFRYTSGWPEYANSLPYSPLNIYECSV